MTNQRIPVATDRSVTLPVNEVFQTIQGEGFFTGTPSIFIRLQGCKVGCGWCDTKHTWEVNPSDQVPLSQCVEKTADSANWAAVNVSDLLAEITSRYVAKHVVITGGEPCAYDLIALTSALIAQGYSVQIETSGVYEVQAHPDTWVTVSPKINMQGGFKVKCEALQRANEIKHPIAMQKHIDELDALLASCAVSPDIPVYLQPISQQKRATQLAVETCINRNWKLSIQTHKYIEIS